MKVRKSITLPRALRAEVDKADRQARDSRDLQILHRQAKWLNQEATDVLEYQKPVVRR